MRPEVAALFELLGVPGPEPRAARGAADARALFELAQRHQVAALVYHLWKSRASCDDARPGIPPEVRPSFRMAFLHHALRNEVLWRNLTELCAALESRGIEALVFKGPWLAFRAYPDPGTRPVDDIDLAIRERDYGGALEVLSSLGYRPDGSVPPDAEGALRRAHYGRQLRFKAWGRRPLELHLRMVNLGPPAPEERWLWERARALQLEGGTIRVPGPEAMLLHVLFHANQHGFVLLRLLFDVRYTLDRARDELDAGAFLALVREHRLRGSAYHGLCLARDLAGAAVPQALLDALRPGPLSRARFEWLWNLGAARALRSRRRRMELESPRFYLLEMGRLRDKARYVLAVMQEAGGPLAFLRRSLARTDR